jgi:hypothetical protein
MDVTKDTRTIWELACAVIDAWKDSMRWTALCRCGHLEQAAEEVRREKAPR